MMKRPWLIGLLVATATLAACQHGQDISFDGRSISLHAGGAPTATITSRGSLSVGSKDIDVTPAQRQLLLRYYNRLTAIHADTRAVTHAGVEVAKQGLQVAGKSVEEAAGLGHATSAATRASAGALQTKAHRIKSRAMQLCHEVEQAQALQSALTAEVPAFKPYANIDPAPGVQC